MARVRTPGDGPKCACGKPAVWSGYCQMEDGRGYCTSKPQAMTKTTAEVNRYGATNQGLQEMPYGMWCQYGDYATLQQRCMELTECVGRLVRIGNDMHSMTKCVIPDCAWVDAVYKAADLLGGEKGLGT